MKLEQRDNVVGRGLDIYSASSLADLQEASEEILAEAGQQVIETTVQKVRLREQSIFRRGKVVDEEVRRGQAIIILSSVQHHPNLDENIQNELTLYDKTALHPVSRMEKRIWEIPTQTGDIVDFSELQSGEWKGSVTALHTVRELRQGRLQYGTQLLGVVFDSYSSVARQRPEQYAPTTAQKMLKVAMGT